MKVNRLNGACSTEPLLKIFKRAKSKLLANVIENCKFSTIYRNDKVNFLLIRFIRLFILKMRLNSENMKMSQNVYPIKWYSSCMFLSDSEFKWIFYGL